MRSQDLATNLGEEQNSIDKKHTESFVTASDKS